MWRRLGTKRQGMDAITVAFSSTESEDVSSEGFAAAVLYRGHDERDVHTSLVAESQPPERRRRGLATVRAAELKRKEREIRAMRVRTRGTGAAWTTSGPTGQNPGGSVLSLLILALLFSSPALAAVQQPQGVQRCRRRSRSRATGPGLWSLSTRISRLPSRVAPSPA